MVIHKLPSGIQYCSTCKATSCVHITPLFPLELSKKPKKVVSKQFHGSSRSFHGSLRLVTDKKKIFERFHSYRKKFNADIDFDSVNGDLVRLRNNVVFKRIEFPEAIVQVFKKSILIILRSSMEIKGLTVKEAILKSNSLMEMVVQKLPLEIKVKDSKLVECHNAFVNHPFAKKEVSVTINGEKRFISDNSKGNPEFEAINPKFVLSDSECIEKDIIDLVDKGFSREFIISSINDLVEDRKFHAENIKSHIIALREMAFLLKRIKNKL